MKDANYGCKDEGNDDGISGQSVISHQSISHQSISCQLVISQRLTTD